MRFSLLAWNGRPFLPEVMFGTQFLISMSFAVWAMAEPVRFQDLDRGSIKQLSEALSILVPSAQIYGRIFSATNGALLRDLLTQIWLGNIVIGSLVFFSLPSIIRFNRASGSTRKFRKPDPADIAAKLYFFTFAVAICIYLGFDTWFLTVEGKFPAKELIYQIGAASAAMPFLVQCIGQVIGRGLPR